MADKDLHTVISGTTSFVTTSIGANGTLNGIIIDMLHWDSVDFQFLSGSSIDADLAITMEHDDDAGFGTAVPVPANFIIGDLPQYLIANAEADTVKSVGYVGKKRYVRINVVTTNFSSATFISGIAIRGDARVEPV